MSAAGRCYYPHPLPHKDGRITRVSLDLEQASFFTNGTTPHMNFKALVFKDVMRLSKAEGVKLTDHLKYRPDIDGLRAFAILSVVLYHSFPSLMLGGFVGVDVFFVISGFLISSIIFKGLDAGGFSFVEFYRRRINRIFPALLLVLGTTYLFGWFTLLSGEFAALGKHIAAGLGFVQNITLYREAGYFDSASDLKPLLHLWSLGVEEQFYILFPLGAWVAWRWRSCFLPIIVIIAIFSFVADVSALSTNPSAAFYLPHFRFWEIMFGSVIGYIGVFRPDAMTRIHDSKVGRNVLSLSGGFLLILSVTLIDKHKPFPGEWALLPVVGSALIILAGSCAWVNRWVLSSKPLVWVGLISYPLYLWHWPVIAYIRILGAEELTILWGILAVSMSMVLAYLTYSIVELPLRRWGSLAKTPVFITSAVALAVMGQMSFIDKGLPNRPGMPSALAGKDSYSQYFENSLPKWSYFTKQGIIAAYRYECDFFDVDSYRAGKMTMEPRKEISSECYTPKTQQKVMIWGDSHAQQYYYGLSKTLSDRISILQVASSGCESNMPGMATGGRRYCDRSNEFAFEVMQREKPQVLIIAQLEQLDVSNKLDQLAAKAKSLGVEKIIVVGPVPRFTQNLYQLVIRKYWAATPRRVKGDLRQEPFTRDRELQDKFGKGQGGFTYISAINGFCDAAGCMTYVGADRLAGLVTFDYGHLSLPASKFFAETVLSPAIMDSLSHN